MLAFYNNNNQQWQMQITGRNGEFFKETNRLKTSRITQHRTEQPKKCCQEMHEVQVLVEAVG